MANMLPSGTSLKNKSYSIRRLLGQGGYGAVYLADDLLLGKPCAIKESFDNSPGAQKQFDVEARILANLNHPHLPRVTDNFVEPATGAQYLVMEYVAGENLEDVLARSGPQPEDKVRLWMDQVLDAVAYLHAYQPRPVIHRDIKPANLRLLPDGKAVKLVDFGIAKIGDSTVKTRDVARAATDGFAPIEQYGTGAGTDTYSDVYALGATMYNLLTNVVPVSAVDRAGGAALDPPRQLNPRISGEMEQIVLTALEMEPKLRYRDAGRMRAALHGGPIIVTTTCPHCGANVRATAKFCGVCSKPIAPVPPFQFKKAGHVVHDVRELVSACDTYWDEAMGYFRRGEFDTWLKNHFGDEGRQLAENGAALRARHTDTAAALEDFLESAAPTRSLPILTVNAARLDFGALRVGDSKVLQLTVSNSGRGYLYGSVQSPLSWLSIHPAHFGCRSGSSLQIEIEAVTVKLAGAELGADFNGNLTVLANRGQQVIPVQVKVVDEPQAHVQPDEIRMGAAPWGARLRGQVTVSNAGGGTLHGTLVARDNWLTIDATGLPFSLGKGQSLPVAVAADTQLLGRRGQHSSQVVVQSNGRGAPMATVTVEVTTPFLLDPAQPATACHTPADAVAACDADWDRGLQWLASGQIEAFFRFIGESTLAQSARDACQQPHSGAALESVLRAAGAPPAMHYATNLNDVLRDLGFGIMPRFGRKPPSLKLLIRNTSTRGYLHGCVNSLAAWITFPQPRFGCLPGQVAEVELHADHKSRKGGIFTLSAELFEIMVE